MGETLRNAWRVPELRKKLIYTFLMLLLYRLVGVVPVPGINLASIQASIANYDALGLVNMMTGNQFSQMTIMAMGITPYINASIIMQLLCVAIPALERLQKDGGEEGRKKINKITRYSTVALAALQAIGIIAGLNGLKADYKNVWGYCAVGIIMAGGTALAMWIGERITKNGIGNGISLLIFAGIISNLFNGIVAAVQYAKRVVGRKMYGGQSTHIPMKVLSVGVLPLIFAYSFMSFPGTVMAMFGTNSGAYKWWSENMNQFTWGYMLLCALLIVAFAYFYTAITFNPQDIAKNLQQQGGHIPGIRSGQPTIEFLSRTSNRLTLFAAIFLAILSTVPSALTVWRSVSIPFGASSILIAVSVALETMQQIEAQLTMRHYRGFLQN